MQGLKVSDSGFRVFRLIVRRAQGFLGLGFRALTFRVMGQWAKTVWFGTYTLRRLGV